MSKNVVGKNRGCGVCSTLADMYEVMMWMSTSDIPSKSPPVVPVRASHDTAIDQIALASVRGE